jgi:hypothetical protein
MTALIAILVDTYRELASKRLFWLSMALSGLVVLIFALIGINEKGMSILGWTLEIPFINSTLMDRPSPNPEQRTRRKCKIRPASNCPGQNQGKNSRWYTITF